MTVPIISIQNVTKRFPGVVALNDVTFEIAQGSMHSIVGENGAGKSTLMKILAGVIPDYEGTLKLRGNDVHFTGTRDAESSGVSIIHQELNLVEELSVAANIFLGRELRNRLGFLDDNAMEKQAADLFQQLDCEISPRALVRSLRVGDQQLVEIAKALSLDAEILIMDEPTSALTESEVERLFRVMERLLSQDVTILYISHKMDEVFRRSNTITVLRDGQHVDTVDTVDCDTVDAKKITHMMVGREIESSTRTQSREVGQPLLDVKNLSLPWPGHAQQWRLRDVSFSLRRGEVVGIAGLMGAGRTELLECLFGANEENLDGSICLEGNPLEFHHPRDAMQAGFALVTEDRKRLGLFSHMTVRDNIMMCTLNDAVTSGLLSFRAERILAEDSIELLGIKTAGTEADVTSLSGGNQQKCIIARWLRTNPKVLLLDDPTRGIDVGAKAELYQVIDQLCSDGMGILITSSELPELISVCDRILVLCEGRLTGELERSQFSEQAIMEAATQRETVTAQ